MTQDAAVSCKNAGVLFRAVMLYYNVFDYPAGEPGIPAFR